MATKPFNIIDWTLKYWTQVVFFTTIFSAGALYAVELNSKVENHAKEIIHFQQIVIKQEEISKDLVALKLQTTRQDEQLKSIKESQDKSEQYLERLIKLNERKK
jgi:DMSO reductase anchor subunit